MNKGLTPVIATVLLMTISVGATGSAFVFLQETQQNAQERAKETIESQQEDSEASINMQYVYNGTDGYSILSLRNTGDVTITLEDDGQKQLNVFVGGRPVEPGGRGWKYTASVTDPDVRLNPGDTRTINTTKSFPSPSQSQVLTVAATNGVRDTHTCYNSGSSNC